MPAAFDRCVSQGGRVRTKSLSGGRYIHICFLNGKSYAGEVKTKSLTKKKKQGYYKNVMKKKSPRMMISPKQMNNMMAKPGMSGKQMRPMMKKKRKMTQAQDNASDRRAGRKEGSADIAQDRRNGIKDKRRKTLGGKPMSAPSWGVKHKKLKKTLGGKPISAPKWGVKNKK